MKKYKIAITGIGGGVGQSIIKSLQNSDYEIVGLDGEFLATGLYVVPVAYIIPYANDPEYIPRLLQICKDENISLLFPGLDAELKILAENRDKFEDIGTKVVVSEPLVIDVSDDKLLTFNHLSSLNIKVPVTIPLAGFNLNELEFPFIIKQQVGGARSKNVFIINNKEAYETLVKELGENNKNFVAQEFIKGDEYTCGSVNLEGECKGVIIMRRILRDGDTYKCFVESDETIEKLLYKLLNSLKPFGACNVQLRMKNDVPYIFEINARCSGTTASRTLSGFNEPLLIADFLLKGKEVEYNILPVTILRYWKELVVQNDAVTQITTNRKILNTQINNL